MGDRITSIAASIVVLAMLSTALTKASGLAQIIRAVGDTFSGSLRAAKA
jgi:hypothetical protein